MIPIRLFVAIVLSLAASCAAYAQGIPPAPTEPTRWTTQPNMIDASEVTSPREDSVFPSLLQESSDGTQTRPDAASKSRLTGPAITVSSSLAVVLGLFAAMVWMTRRFGSRGASQGVIPRDVVQSLGTTAIDSRTRVNLLRCGNRILVVAQTASGLHSLSEITDADEVRQLTAACLGDAGQSFGSTLRSIEREPVQPGFAGHPQDNGGVPPTATAGTRRSRLFATA